MTVLVTMNVAETMKGSAAKTIQFRQYIWDIRDQLDASSYRKGDELLLLLIPTSANGLRSPAGLEQGRFRIVTTAGKSMAVNGRGNFGLFREIATRMQSRGMRLSGVTAKLAREQASGPIPLTDLKEAIRTLSGASR